MKQTLIKLRSQSTAELAAIVCAALLVGCSKQGAPSPAAPASKPITKTATRGPVTLTVQVDKDTITIAEKLHWTITAEAEDGVEVELPAFGEDVKDLVIHDFTDESAVPTPNGRRRWRQRYELDSLVSGEYRLPEVKATFTDGRQPTLDRHAGEPIVGELAVEPIEVKITSLLEGTFDPTNFHDIKSPVALPEPVSHAWIWWTAGAATCLGGLIALMLAVRRRRRRGPSTVTVPPHQWAFAELERLIEDDLIAAGDVHEFYFRLTDIVRIYIERRFQLAAPEQTSEEFLETMRGNSVLSAEHQALLIEFLRAADLVKFARYEPGKQEVERAFNSARDFIDETAERRKEVAIESAQEQAA